MWKNRALPTASSVSRSASAGGQSPGRFRERIPLLYSLNQSERESSLDGRVTADQREPSDTDKTGSSGQEARDQRSGDVVVGIPAYNEEVAIGSTVLLASHFADEVIVVDDGSSDQTAKIAERAGATVIRHRQNRGKGSAIRTLFDYTQAIEYEALVLIDGDGQHLPTDIPRVTEPVLNDDADLVIGSRYIDSSFDTETPLYRRFGQLAFDHALRWISETPFSDTQSGFRSFSPEAVRELVPQSNGITVESEISSKAAESDLDIEEIPIRVRYDGVDGQTYNSISHGLVVVMFLLRKVKDKYAFSR